MKLKRMNDYLDFIKAVQGCEGDVFFHSSEGDQLNLQSDFCRIMFASACTDQEYLSDGVIVCQKSQDYQKLQDYLMADA